MAGSEHLTFAHAANAIAAFEIDHWTLLGSPFDVYQGGDDTALSERAKGGGLLFFGQAGGARCHNRPLLTDELFYNRAVPQLGPGKGDGDDGTWDFGRERVTGDEADETVPITLTDEEVAQVLAFLESLTSPSVGNPARNDTPERVPSGLPLAD